VVVADLDHCLAIAAKVARRYAARYGWLRSRQILGDLTQEAALWIVLFSSDYDPLKAPLDAWAHMVAKWGVKDWLGKDHRHSRRFQPLERDDNSDHVLYPNVLADYLSLNATGTYRERHVARRKRRRQCLNCAAPICAGNVNYCQTHLELANAQHRQRRAAA
jgi:hypothetical protein